MTTVTRPKKLSKAAAFLMKTTTQWVDAGGLSTGWFHLCQPVVEDRPKAIGVKAKKWNASATDLIDTVAWFPRSQVVPVADDYYEHKIEGQNYLVPQWLQQAKQEEGYEF